MKQERNGLVLLNFLLVLALVLLHYSAKAQNTQMPLVFNQDPAYWYDKYMSEMARADGLQQSGKAAIAGLKSSLQAANDTITKQNERIAAVATTANYQKDRADKAEGKLQVVTDELDRYKGKTIAGKLIRKGRDGLAVIVAIAILILTIK